jgi:hypothetical protein
MSQTAPDFVLIGNGLAPLVVARRLLEEGHRLLVLNPDDDFFREDSELPFDPIGLGDGAVTPARIRDALGERLLADISPVFPGAMQHWSSAKPGHQKYQDFYAPFVRSRGWVWLLEEGWRRSKRFSPEETYVEASDAGIQAQWIEGPVAYRQIPGVSPHRLAEILQQETVPAQALSIQGLADFDIDRYRQGLLEFVRERLGKEQVVCGAGAIELVEEGIRYAGLNGPQVVAPSKGTLVFWSPRLSPWLVSQAKRHSFELPKPKGFRAWEQWRLVSRDPVDPSWVAIAGDCALWAEVEGDPKQAACFRLSILRDTGLFATETQAFEKGASSDSFQALESVCRSVLGWEGLTVRSLRIRVLPEWEGAGQAAERSWGKKRPFKLRVLTACEGPGAQVVRRSAAALAEVLK